MPTLPSSSPHAVDNDIIINDSANMDGLIVRIALAIIETIGLSNFYFHFTVVPFLCVPHWRTLLSLLRSDPTRLPSPSNPGITPLCDVG